MSNRIPKGVNLIGFAKSEHGLGEAVRLTADALSCTSVKWSVFDFELNNPCRQTDKSLDSKITNVIEYNKSIIQLNADMLLKYENKLPPAIRKTYRIGVWYWELPLFPQQWKPAYRMVDEIWAPTKFIQECLQKDSPVPVIYMPPGISRCEPQSEYDRAYFGLPDNTFLFLSMYDPMGWPGRKNPKASINAFKKAFRWDDNSVGLVLKLNNVTDGSRHCKELKKLIGEYKNIYLIPQIMSREEVNGLINICDAAVSLHRSEGLGLLCQEAMYYGKPVIATGWSGNMDFMNGENSCLVGYELIPVDEYNGVPKNSGQLWADPNLDEAAEYMKKLYSDIEYREMKANAGMRTIGESFSPQVCGKRMEQRLNKIDFEKAGSDSESLLWSMYSDDIDALHSTAFSDFLKPKGNNGSFLGIKNLLQELIQKFCSSIITPLLGQQSDFNESTANIIVSLEEESITLSGKTIST